MYIWPPIKQLLHQKRNKSCLPHICESSIQATNCFKIYHFNKISKSMETKRKQTNPLTAKKAAVRPHFCPWLFGTARLTPPRASESRIASVVDCLRVFLPRGLGYIHGLGSIPWLSALQLRLAKSLPAFACLLRGLGPLVLSTTVAFFIPCRSERARL